MNGQPTGSAESAPARKLAPAKWAAGALAFFSVVAGSIYLGFWLSGSPGGGPAAGQAVAAGGVGAAVVFVLGLVVFLVGAAAWGIVLGTGAFTFNYQRPLLPGYSTKLWLLNVVVGLLIEGGFALMLAPLLIPPLLRVLPPGVAMGVGFFAPFVFAQLLFVWIQMWAPLERIVIRRRLIARGLPPGQLALGRFVGTSDPSRSSFRKFGLVEDDLGMLWIGPDRLVFWGDRGAWEIPHAQLAAIERQADAGSTASYFGAVHVMLRYRDAMTDAEGRIRLHPQTDWTMTAKARALDEIAERLTMWHQTPTPGWVSGPSAFAIAAATSATPTSGDERAATL